MIDLMLLIPLLSGFFIVIFVLPFWIRKAGQIGLIWDDMNKFSSEKVSGSGGIIVLLGFLVSVFLYIAYNVFFFNNSSHLVFIFSLTTVVILMGGIGFIDDLLGWKKGGLSRRSRLLLVIFSSIPLIAINAGKSAVSLPFLGNFDFGVIYPLLLIPIGIAGATTTFNFLAGFNGLEAGQSVIFLSALSLVSYFTGSHWLSFILLCMVFSLLAFLIFNFYPAKIFPGDSLTYSVGALIGVCAIIGNFEKIAVFFFIPYILEVILKSRGSLIKQSFGKPKKDGSLGLRYNKIYGLEHLSIYLMEKTGIKPTEKKVVFSIWAFQIVIISIGVIIFRQGIFG